VVSWDKEEAFRGKEALAHERDTGVRRRLAGLATEGRQPPRAGATVTAGGTKLGEVTSGNYSPVLGHGIALAFLPPEVAVGSEVEIDLRGHPVPATVVALPFVDKKKS
jgi:aminomethyltransferase